MSSTIKINIDAEDEFHNNDCVVKLTIPSGHSNISIRCDDGATLKVLSESKPDQNANINVSEKKVSPAKQNGLDRKASKEIILKHIKDNNKNGASLPEIRGLFPHQTKDQVQHLLRELKADNKIVSRGRGGFARWHYKK